MSGTPCRDASQAHRLWNMLLGQSSRSAANCRRASRRLGSGRWAAQPSHGHTADVRVGGQPPASRQRHQPSAVCHARHGRHAARLSAAARPQACFPWPCPPTLRPEHAGRPRQPWPERRHDPGTPWRSPAALINFRCHAPQPRILGGDAPRHGSFQSAGDGDRHLTARSRRLRHRGASPRRSGAPTGRSRASSRLGAWSRRASRW
jgi:hypothetical protein